MLVLGYTNPALLPALNLLPFPNSLNQTFSDASIQLAPGVFFSNVFVPTPAQRTGVFTAFSQPLIDPVSGIPFAQNLIPTSRLFGDNGLFAFEVGPASSAAPEPAVLSLMFGGVLFFALFGAVRKHLVPRPMKG